MSGAVNPVIGVGGSVGEIVSGNGRGRVRARNSGLAASAAEALAIMVSIGSGAAKSSLASFTVVDKNAFNPPRPAASARQIVLNDSGDSESV